MSRLAPSFVAVALVASLAPPSALQAQVLRVGGEFQVNFFTTSAQHLPVVGVSEKGSFVVVWASLAQDGDAYGLFGRRFGSSGDGLGGEFQINEATIGSQRVFGMAMNGSGEFVVVWEDSSARDGDSVGIFGRRFNSLAVAQGVDFQVNSYTSGGQRRPAVGIDASGNFVAVWDSLNQDLDSYGVFGRTFNSAGVGQAAEFQVNVVTETGQSRASVSAAHDGDFVVTWSSYAGAPYGDILGRRFASSGAAIGNEFQVPVSPTGTQRGSAVAAFSGGDFVVVWRAFDGNGYGVLARRFLSDGSALGPDFLVNSYFTGDQSQPRVGVDPSGGFVIAWNSTGQDGSTYGVFARQFGATGAPTGEAFAVNSYTSGQQQLPSVGVSANGDFMIVWSSAGQDGASNGVFAQRYVKLKVLDIDGNGTVTALSDGLLVLRYLFGFTGSTLVGGAVDLAGCTRCDASSIQGYLEGLV